LTSDIQGANNYGLDACWFNPQGKSPGAQYNILYEISALGELTQILQ
jgi:FMN phosphatase YigB (HAD superfamily)